MAPAVVEVSSGRVGWTTTMLVALKGTAMAKVQARQHRAMAEVTNNMATADSLRQASSQETTTPSLLLISKDTKLLMLSNSKGTIRWRTANLLSSNTNNIRKVDMDRDRAAMDSKDTMEVRDTTEAKGTSTDDTIESLSTDAHG